jgi:large subunit ribosomal protein L16
MLFIPKFSKFKKSFRAKPIKRIYKKIDHPSIINGSIGLKILSSGLMSSDQLKAVRQVINKIIKRIGKIQFFSFPNATISKKSSGSRMGKGKGGKNYWVCKLQPGFMFCMINTSLINVAKRALKAAQFRMPVATKIVINNFN